MSNNTDTIEALTESVTKSLGEIVSLNQTVKLHEGTIADLNKKNGELTLELSDAQDKGLELVQQITGLNKELNSHEELVKKLEGENKALSATVEKLEKGKSVKKSKAASQN